MKNGEALKRCREARGLSQSELAKRADISVRVLQSLEQGLRDINKSSLEMVLRLAESLEVDVYDIINERERSYWRGEWHT